MATNDEGIHDRAMAEAAAAFRSLAGGGRPVVEVGPTGGSCETRRARDVRIVARTKDGPEWTPLSTGGPWEASPPPRGFGAWVEVRIVSRVRHLDRPELVIAEVTVGGQPTREEWEAAILRAADLASDRLRALVGAIAEIASDRSRS